MTRRNEKSGRNNPPENPTPNITGNPTGGGIGNSGNEQNAADKRIDKEPSKKNQPIVVNVIQPDVDRTEAINANTIAKEANKASWWSVKVNGGLLVFTIALAGISFGQYISSQSAAKIARETLDSTVSYNKRLVASQKIADNKSDSLEKASAKKYDSAERAKFIRDTTAFGLQKKITNAQIQSFKDHEREFKIENTANLQFVMKYIDSPMVKNKIIIHYTLSDIGKQQVQVTQYRTTTIMEDSTFKDSIFFFSTLKKMPLTDESFYIVQGQSTESRRIRVGVGYDDIHINKLLTGKQDLFLIGEFFYTKLVTQEKCIYRFVAQMFDTNIVNGKMGYRLLFNENIPIKPESVK